jgi:hypothetical protein
MTASASSAPSSAVWVREYESLGCSVVITGDLNLARAEAQTSFG